MMPDQKPGKSNQSYATPDNFIRAVTELLGLPDKYKFAKRPFLYDLAADETNTRGYAFFSQEQNSLIQEWHSLPGAGDRWYWLNPPFSKIKPWVKKCFFESREGAKIACLIPASVGSNWWAEYVYGKAQVYYLRDRITFVGCKDPYPKDLALLLYRPEVLGGESLWDWKSSI